MYSLGRPWKLSPIHWEAYLDLCSHLLDKKNYRYVLLGKFQTDPLEFRFSTYRSMAGSNFHVSIQNILEGEKKLKMVNVLKMVSASKGAVTFKDFSEPLFEKLTQQETSSCEEFRDFLHIFEDCNALVFSDAQLKALVVVTGYTVFKLLQELKCEDCKALMSTDKKMEVYESNEYYSYLNDLDRGGLTWPSEFSVNCITELFKIFQTIIQNKDTEARFLSVRSQRKTLHQLGLERVKELDLCSDTCNNCETKSLTLISKCFSRAVNCFLNNYSKNLTDFATTGTSKGQKKRKVATFSKRK